MEKLMMVTVTESKTPSSIEGPGSNNSSFQTVAARDGVTSGLQDISPESLQGEKDYGLGAKDNLYSLTPPAGALQGIVPLIQM